MQCFLEGLYFLCWYDDTVEVLTVVEGMTAQVLGHTAEGNGFQFVALGKGIALDGCYRSWDIDVVEAVAVVEGVLADSGNRRGDDDILQ